MENAQGGLKIGGDTYQIQFIHEDDKLSPEGAVAAGTKLIDQDNVKFIFGATMTPSSEALYKITEPAGVLMVYAMAQDPTAFNVGADKPLLVMLYPTQDQSYKPFYDYLVKNYPNAKKLVHCDCNYGYDKMIAKAESTAEADGLQVVGTELYDYSWTDFYPFATTILKHSPDVVSISNLTPELAPLIFKDLRELGFKGPILSFGSVPPSPILSGVGAENAYDIICNQAYAGAPSAPPAMQAVKKSWEAKYPGDPWNDDPLMPYQEAWALFQGIEKAQSLDPAVVLKTMEGMTAPGSLQTPYGPGYMGGLKTLGANREIVRPIPITLIQHNNIDMVEWITPSLP